MEAASYSKQIARILLRVVNTDKKASLVVCTRCQLPFVAYSGATKCIECSGVLESRQVKQLAHNRAWESRKKRIPRLKEAA